MGRRAREIHPRIEVTFTEGYERRVTMELLKIYERRKKKKEEQNEENRCSYEHAV